VGLLDYPPEYDRWTRLDNEFKKVKLFQVAHHIFMLLTIYEFFQRAADVPLRRD
jgi:hypothetical protein